MPTTKPRHPVTETPEITAALAAAARRWPEDQGRPSRLLRRLIEEGRKSIDPEVADQRSERIAALRQVSGSYTGLYDRGYLENLRAEWPE